MPKPKRTPKLDMPEMIPDTPENVAKAITRTRPPRGGWSYLKKSKRSKNKRRKK